METDSDNSDSDSTCSLVGDLFDRGRKRSQHQHFPHACIATVIGPCNLVQLGTPCLPVPVSRDDYLTDISGFFMESYIAYLGDVIDDIHLLFDEEYPSSVVTREYSDPLVHTLHDQSYKVDIIVDPYVQ